MKSSYFHNSWFKKDFVQFFSHCSFPTLSYISSPYITGMWKVSDGNKANLLYGITDQHCMLLYIGSLSIPSLEDHYVHKTIPGRVVCWIHCKHRANSSVWTMLVWHIIHSRMVLGVCQLKVGVHFSISYLCGLTCRTTLSSNAFLMVFSICLRKTWGTRPHRVLTVSRNLVWMG